MADFLSAAEKPEVVPEGRFLAVAPMDDQQAVDLIDLCVRHFIPLAKAFWNSDGLVIPFDDDDTMVLARVLLAGRVTNMSAGITLLSEA